MKKIFFILCVLMLMTSAIVSAQILSADNEEASAEAIYVSGRKNAVQDVANYIWRYTDIESSYFNVNGYRYWGTSNGYVVYQYQWNCPENGSLAIKLVMSFSTANAGLWENPYDDVSYVMPPKGNYSFSTSTGSNRISNYNAGNSWKFSGTLKCSMLVLPSGTSTYIHDITSNNSSSNGRLTIAEGADGPYITTTNVNSGYGARVYTTAGKGPYGYYLFTIGSPAVYKTINVLSSNNTMGTTSWVYKSGYVYPNSRVSEFKLNSVYTITAIPKEGYRFVAWSDGGAQSHDITVTGNATYTAYFEPDITEMILPFGATEVTDEQKTQNPTYVAYPTELKDEVPTIQCY